MKFEDSFEIFSFVCLSFFILLMIFVFCFQESYFNWAFGVQAPDYMGAIEVSTGRSILFMPRLPPDYSIWMGKLETPEEAKKRFEVDEVYYTDEVGDYSNLI